MSIRNDLIDNLLIAFETIVTSSSYVSEIKAVKAFSDNMLTKFRGELPILTVIDSGNEQILCADGTHWRFGFDVEALGFLSGESNSNTQERLNAILADLQRFSNSSPSLGDNALGIIYLEGLDHAYSQDGYAQTGARFRIIYYREKPTSEAEGSDIEGDQFADDARDKVVTLMNALKTTIASNDPTFSYVYDHHNAAKLQLNAVTVEVVSAAFEAEGVDNGSAGEWTMEVSCRVHTAYAGGSFDERGTMRLAESVANKLMANSTDMDDNYRLTSILRIENRQVFDESATIGAEIIAEVKFYVCYQQE